MTEGLSEGTTARLSGCLSFIIVLCPSSRSQSGRSTTTIPRHLVLNSMFPICYAQGHRHFREECSGDEFPEKPLYESLCHYAALSSLLSLCRYTQVGSLQPYFFQHKVTLLHTTLWSDVCQYCHPTVWIVISLMYPSYLKAVLPM